MLYAWYKQEYFVDAFNKFKQQYGIDAKVIIGDRVGNFNKALAEKDAATGTIDVMVAGGDSVKPMIETGMMLGPLKPRIAHADKLTPALWEKQEGVETKGYLAPLMRNQTGLLYDPERVQNPPKTWDELTAWIDANPKRFGFNDPSKGGSGQAFVMTLLKFEAGGLDKYYGDTEVEASRRRHLGQGLGLGEPRARTSWPSRARTTTRSSASTTASSGSPWPGTTWRSPR